MQELENGRFTIIPIELLSLIVEKTENGLKHIGAPEDISVEDTLNEVRIAINFQIQDQRSKSETVNRLWKRFQATKEFMDPRELQMNEAMWAGFDHKKYEGDKTRIISGLEKSMFELTEVMLDNNVPIHALDSIDGEDPVEIRTTSLEEIKNMFDGFGKKE
jgi:hypothetical protein